MSECCECRKCGCDCKTSENELRNHPLSFLEQLMKDLKSEIGGGCE